IGGTSFDLTTLSGSGKVATVTFGVWSHAENFDVLMEDPMLLNINHAPTTLGSVIVNQNS
ncbi:MAG: hypothetical protein JSV51_03555, partial [Candidatus Bathyarchaeota archaeon]